jgi:hypothetical protein
MSKNQKSWDIWNYKPWWCQPWSILLTGIVLIFLSWLLFSNLIITVIFSTLILLWWVYFLILYPRLLAEVLSKDSKVINLVK